MKTRHIVGTAVIIVFLIWGASVFLDTTIQYVSIEEAAQSRSVVQVMGKIDFDRVTYNTDDLRLEFAVYDPQAVDTANAERLHVVYYGVIPGNFNQASTVVLKGKPGNDGVFIAERMLVKCPSKYQGEVGEEYQDIRKHEDAASSSGV